MDAQNYQNPFAVGVIVFFREIDNNTHQLASSVHPTGRSVSIHSQNAHPEDYVILDGNGQLVGLYPRDWVACILPLQPGPNINVADQQNRSSDPTAPTQGNPQGIIGRA